jgi:hypothetical protein
VAAVIVVSTIVASGSVDSAGVGAVLGPVVEVVVDADGPALVSVGLGGSTVIGAPGVRAAFAASDCPGVEVELPPGSGCEVDDVIPAGEQAPATTATAAASRQTAVRANRRCFTRPAFQGGGRWRVTPPRAARRQ